MKKITESFAEVSIWSLGLSEVWAPDKGLKGGFKSIKNKQDHNTSACSEVTIGEMFVA